MQFVGDKQQEQMLRQIYIDKYNKIVCSFKAEIFGSLTVLESRPYSPTVERYVVVDQQNQPYQLYYTTKQLQMVLQEIPFVQQAPKVLVFPGEKENIIIEGNIDENLYETLLDSEQQPQFVSFAENSELQARRILQSLRSSLLNYRQHNIPYNAIHPKNIVRKNLDWQLSVAGLLLKNQRQHEDYYKSGVAAQCQAAYALGTLLFKLLFGFAPFERKRELIKFSFKDYPRYLDKQENKKYLKVYAYAQGLLQVSTPAKHLIQQSLTGTITLQAFYAHRYFQQAAVALPKKDLNPATKQVRMLTMLDQSHQSLVMAAIEHRQKYPHQRLNAKLLYAHELTKEETVEHLRKHPVLGQMRFDPNFKEQKVEASINQPQHLPLPDLPYFYREEDFDPEFDRPCIALFKLIESEKKSSEIHDQETSSFEERVKMYAFPYAIVFELFKVAHLQATDLQLKILKLADDLLQISQLNYSKQIQPLHATHLALHSFDDIKIRFRERINELYKHFLAEAIKKYNVRKELVSLEERTASKALGLEYYKLCLKLIECSLINRKKGRDLDLQRIETSTRKEIEADLNLLLKQYFPNKIEHS